MAAEAITASYIIPNIDSAKLKDCVIKIAELQTKALEHTNVSFDKAPRDYANIAEYRKARQTYFAKAYKSLIDTFNNQVQEILHEMNSALPK